jgi:hypothetical protein
MSSVVNIRRIIDVATVIQATAATRRDFRNVLFVFKGEEVNSLRVNSYTSYADVVTAYGSNTEPVKAALKHFSGGFNGIKPNIFWVANFDQSGGEVWATVIAELLQDPRYYFFELDNTFTEDEEKELAAAIEASTKIKYIGAFLDRNLTAASAPLASDETSLTKAFYEFDYARIFTLYDTESASANYKQASALSYFATVNYTKDRPLGSLAFKTFSGQVATDFGSNVDSYTQNLQDKNCNYYTDFGEVGRTNAYAGVLANGTQINVQVGADWLEYNITYAIYDLLNTLPNLTYTQEEFNMLYSAIDTVCQQAVAFKLLAPGVDSLTGEKYPTGYKISIPAPSSISAADKALGKLTGVTVTGILAGSVIKLELTNILKY